ncbi:NBS-LRR disease resistance protein NBS50 [Cinnamomum micranthum f. kanehirae]|uniref:NBS-LRR disease resistance protein NBS50 n=1 Tax=Cinnamomum micranthum f. kanehirae TaxID=337451 RepID=A0A443P4F3_9MAGN|nr:NBS-LRR disease resistance protein NBS50 [Cinnamomum micranthum f. kanehirae]
MADAVVGVLVEKLVRLLLEEGQQLLELDDQFNKMKDELRYVKTYLKDVETMRRKDGKETLKLITQDLRELVYDAEDIIADCQVHLMKEHNGCLADFLSYCSPRLLKFRHKIAKRLKVDEEGLRMKEVVDLLRTLLSKLEDEKYLMVLDDVWENEMSWWNSLNSALPKRSGCCVIVTTRNEAVAKSMGAIDRHINRPQILSDDDSWSLFAKIAFARDGGRCPNSNLESIGQEIVARCRGLPLAIKVVGGMMLGKGDSVHEWRENSTTPEGGDGRKEER